MESKVKDYPDLRRSGAGVINTNRDQYRAALARRKNTKRLGTLEDRVSSLESKIDTIIELLQRQNDGSN